MMKMRYFTALLLALAAASIHAADALPVGATAPGTNINNTAQGGGGADPADILH